ncbi:MAG: hypothetical protein IJA81_02645 [Akkermansia sp.]|nr:hypothetical protein [Akkermansia sp.]
MSPMLADFLWVSNGEFLHWMLAVSLTLLVVDIFINTDILTLLAMGLFAAWGILCVAPPAQWGVLTFIVFILLWAGLYYGLWRKLISPIVNGYVRKRAPEDDLGTILCGKTGTVCGEPGSYCIKVGDQLFPIAAEYHDTLHEGERVRITRFAEGVAHIETI